LTDVLLNFRAALLAIAPLAERVGIPWKRPDAYDEWDTIATSLFESLIVRIVRWSVPEELQGELRIPPYDLLLESYRDMATIEVTHPALGRGRWMFHAFATVENPFDAVEVRQLSDHGDPVSNELGICPVAGATFVVRIVRAGASTLIEEVIV
jgi:hypothetical protein